MKNAPRINLTATDGGSEQHCIAFSATASNKLISTHYKRHSNHWMSLKRQWESPVNPLKSK